MSLSIDIWALGCTIYSVLGHGSPFWAVGGRPLLLALIVVRGGGKDNIPESFQNALSKIPFFEFSEEILRTGDQRDMNWECDFRGQTDGIDPTCYADTEPLGVGDHAV